MKVLPNEIILRPRFRINLNGPAKSILQLFQNADTSHFIVKISDHHVFIKFNKSESHFWSPQLQIEVVDQEDGNSIIYGLFGPNPTLWTFFMFVHFGVATLFIFFGVWAYSNNALGKEIGLQLALMALMVVAWVVLYVFGRIGKRKGKPQMHQLHEFMLKHTKEGN
ncbi:GTP-binding protein [Arenibacter sp. BSSL-BM3]|uniref:GTP-binding protein n=1 Tax=Arenibacter arenosicollis TaxID=2762274 RepID=A0ABR7QT81_9FLAO|nr:GTP-binding protein [Arenibacter arenosicollis]MBC8770394.1 GTP-binding protein [Arenibacter arenosicollis]